MSHYARWIELRRWPARLRFPAILALVWSALPAATAAQTQEVTVPPQPPAAEKVIREARPGEIYVPPQARRKASSTSRSDIRERVDRLWHNRKTVVMETTADPGPESLKMILESLRHQGYSSAAGMEANLLCEAHLLLDREYPDQARRSLDSAVSLNPGYLPALSARAEISLSRTPLRAPGPLVDAISSLAESFWPALTSLTNLVLVLALTVLVMTGLLQLVLVARYQKLFRHSVYEAWGEKLPAVLLPVFGWCLLLAPLLLFFGPFWLFCCWTAMLWRFATRVERLLALLSLILLAFLVPAVDTVEHTYRDLNTGDLRLFSDALQDKLLSPRGEELIRTETGEHELEGPLSYEQERRFLVASLHQKMGRDDEAFQSYASIPVYHHLYPMAQNNIGNIYFAMKQFDLSIQHYRKAIDVRPDYAECYFNLSSAQFQVYDFDHSDQSLGRAQQLAPLAIGKLINEESRGLRTLDHRIPRSFLWELAWEALRHNAGRHFAGLNLVIPGGNPASRGGEILILPAAALLSAFAGLLLGWFQRHAEIAHCRSCGRAYCRHCGPDPMKKPHCQQCSQLESRRSGISPEIQKRKLGEIRRFQLWTRLREGLLALTAPGLENMRRGRTCSGGLVAGIWIFLVVVVLTLPGYLPWIGLCSPPWSLNPLVLAAAVLGALLWTVNLAAWVVRVLRSGGWRLQGTLNMASGQAKSGDAEGGD